MKLAIISITGTIGGIAAGPFGILGGIAFWIAAEIFTYFFRKNAHTLLQICPAQHNYCLFTILTCYRCYRQNVAITDLVIKLKYYIIMLAQCPLQYTIMF